MKRFKTLGFSKKGKEIKETGDKYEVASKKER